MEITFSCNKYLRFHGNCFNLSVLSLPFVWSFNNKNWADMMIGKLVAIIVETKLDGKETPPVPLFPNANVIVSFIPT